MTAPQDDDSERDAWLREALRHAPDAQAAPPAEISERILRQAHDAVRPVRAAAPANRLLQLWSWLARPPVAAGFASVMVATVVGVMWWDKPLDDALPHAAPSVVAPPPAAESRAAAAASVPKPAAPTPAQDLAQERTQERTQAEQKARAKAGPAAKESAQRAAPRAEKPSPRDALADAKRERAPEPPARAADTEARQRVADAAPAATVTAPAPAAAPSPATTPAPAPAPTAAAAPSPSAPAPAAENAARPPATQGFAKSAPAAAPTALALRRQDTALRTPVIDDATRWTWQRAGATQPLSPALQRWLTQLDQAANWRATGAPPPPASAGNTLRLWRDAELRAVIQLQDDAAWLMLPGITSATAPLSPAEVAALRAALTAAAP